MEYKIKIIAAIFVAITMGLTTYLLIGSFKNLPPIEADTKEPELPQVIKTSYAIPEGKAKRKSITFILGDDKKPDNRYYWEATNYYKSAPEAKTDELVTHCRSLLEARNYLEENATPGAPWGLINMVVHSNEWSGMEVPVLPEGNRATVQSVKAALDGELFPPLSKAIVDKNSIIYIHGCALGKNENLLEVLKEAFIGKLQEDISPTLKSSPYFILYESNIIDGLPVSKKYNAVAYYAFFKRGYRPGDIRLSNQLKTRYPNAANDWRSALERTSPRFSGDLYHYTFNLPIVWTVTYPDKASRPALKTKEAQEAWLKEQPELFNAIKELGISKDLFTWTFRNINHTFEDGVTEPGIKVIGFCTVLCVLEVLDDAQYLIELG